MDKFYVIDEAMRNALIEYLSTKPYREVAQVIPMLAGAATFKPADQQAEPKQKEKGNE